MAFPQTPVPLLAEMQIGGTWTDITSDLYARAPLTIQRGRQDEGQRVEASKASFQLDNRDNAYSPRNPRSANYGLIGRNTPIRFSVTGAEPYLQLTGASADTASTPDTAALDITGDIDLRIEASVDWYATAAQILIGKWSATAGQRSYRLAVQAGFLQMIWTTDGSTTSFGQARLPEGLARRAAVRATLDVNDGSGGWTVRLYTADSLDGTWKEFTTSTGVTGVGVTSIFSSTSTLQIAPTSGTVLPTSGRIHRAEVRSGIGGSAVANPDFRTQTAGATSFSDGAGRTWTINGAAAISDREYRLHAEVSSWPSRWDESGHDVYVPAESSGILRRLGQGAKQLGSALRRRIPAIGSPVAYWPMEEGRLATQAYSPIDGIAPLAVTSFDFAADDTLLGSASLPKLGAGATMSGTVPAYTGTGQWMVACVFYWPTAPASSTTFLDFTTTGTAARVRLTVDATGVVLDGFTAGGASVFTEAVVTGGTNFHGAWTRLEITAAQSGGNTDYRIGWIDVNGDGWGSTNTVAAVPGIVTGISTVFGALTEGVTIGHLGVFPSSSTIVYESADNGWLGEQAGARMVRLGTEEGVSLVADAASIGMGSQRPNSLLTLLAQCEDSDGGVLYEDRAKLGLRYRSRVSLQNQPVRLTLDYTQTGHVAPPLEPVPDDQRTRNDRTVQRDGGSSARAVAETGPLSIQAPPAGVGTYDDSITLSLSSDRVVEQIAAWRLYLGTWDEERYPTVHINLAAAPSLIPAVLALDIGDRIQIINPPAWLPPGPIDLIVEGYTETIGHPNDWDIVLNCTPAGPWTVGVTDDLVLGRVDTAGSQLASGVTSSATSLSVATSGALWTTAGAEFPFDIQIDGEVMTVSAISGASSPQTFTLSARAVNGVVRTHLAGADVRLAHPAIVAY